MSELRDSFNNHYRNSRKGGFKSFNRTVDELQGNPVKVKVEELEVKPIKPKMTPEQIAYNKAQRELDAKAYNESRERKQAAQRLSQAVKGLFIRLALALVAFLIFITYTDMIVIGFSIVVMSFLSMISAVSAIPRSSGRKWGRDRRKNVGYGSSCRKC